MEWKDLAPWITIAITLALSILVPLFTQIANNNHQRKMQKEKFEYEQKQKKIVTYENFLKNVGGAIASPTYENLSLAASSIQQMYIYAPAEWWDDLRIIFNEIKDGRNQDAAKTIENLNRSISIEVNFNNK